MATHIVIHRGTNQIGGCVTEIKTEKHRIFIDFGEELPGTESDNHNLKIEGLNYEGKKCDGVFLPIIMEIMLGYSKQYVEMSLYIWVNVLEKLC